MKVYKYNVWQLISMVAVLCAGWVSVSGITSPKPSTNDIKWQVISGGGGINDTSAIYEMSCTVGQTAVGSGNSDNYSITYGFWQGFISLGDCGDANTDWQINVGDAVFIINHVFKGGPAPDPLCVGDANGDGGVNVGDAVYLIAYVFKGGPPPVEGCCP